MNKQRREGEGSAPTTIPAVPGPFRQVPIQNGTANMPSDKDGTYPTKYPQPV